MTSVWNPDPRSHGEHKIWSEEESRDQILCNNDLISEGLPKILVLGSTQSQGSFVLYFLQFSEHKVNAKHMVGSLSPVKINYMLSGMHQTHDVTRSRNQWSCSSSLDSCLFFWLFYLLYAWLQNWPDKNQRGVATQALCKIWAPFPCRQYLPVSIAFELLGRKWLESHSCSH